MEAWRADWDELQKAINGNTIDDALLQSMLRSHRGRSSPTKFVVSEEQMYLASVQSGGVPTLGTPVRKQSPPSQPETEPEMGPSEGVPPQASALQAPARPLRGLARLAGASVEQDLLSSILSEARPASVAPPPAHDSAEQDLLRRTGLAPAAAAAGVRATRTAGAPHIFPSHPRPNANRICPPRHANRRSGAWGVGRRRHRRFQESLRPVGDAGHCPAISGGHRAAVAASREEPGRAYEPSFATSGDLGSTWLGAG